MSRRFERCQRWAEVILDVLCVGLLMLLMWQVLLIGLGAGLSPEVEGLSGVVR